MSNEFNTTILYIKKIKSRYFHALSAFHIYKTLNELLAPNIVGQDVAEKNSAVMQNLKDFFMPIKEALRVYFFLELAKLFDVSDQSLHIARIINYTQSNIAKLTANDFAEYDQEREFLDNLIKSYQGISNNDLLILKSEIEKHKNVIEKVKTYRDKYLAHDDTKKVEVSITSEEIQILFSVVEKILNIFSSKLNSTTFLWDHVEKNTKEQTEIIIDHLKRFEPYRLKEIDEKCKNDLIKLSSLVKGY